jgi:hypothetical protein
MAAWTPSPCGIGSGGRGRTSTTVDELRFDTVVTT